MKKIFTLTAAVALLATAAYAVPAKQGFNTYIQPDGTTVQLQQCGDEFSHYYLTTDGVPVLQNEAGYFCYASDENGSIAISGYKAEDPAMRNQDANSYASSISIAKFNAAMQTRMLERISAKAARRSARVPAKAESDKSLPQNGLGLFTTNYPRKGKIHSLVFLVQYKDVKFTVSNPSDYYTRMLNSKGFSDNGGTGSAHDYFTDQSHGQFDPTFDVYGPMTLKNNRSYYGSNDSNGEDMHPEEMALEAAAYYKDQIDYSQYDFDNDGCIDNVYVIYAGVGEASSNVAASVWPHSWEVENGPTYNGKKLFSYTCSNEWESNAPDGIGTFVHEFSHVLGLPDLYHTTNSTAYYTPCEWSVMDYGPYNNDGRTPPNYSSYERNALGWMQPTLLDGPASVTLESIDKSNQAYLIQTEKTNEFFLLENRQLNGWDKYLPNHGMLIWHVDFNQTIWDNNVVNNTKNHQYVDIVEANNKNDGSSTTIVKGYTYPGTSKNTSFTTTSTPALKSWSGKAIDMPITNIAEANGIISFDAAGGNFELSMPETPALSASDHGTVTLSWPAVERATSYLVNIWHNEDTRAIVYDYTDYNVTGTSVTLDGFREDLEYFFTVSAKAGQVVSEPSAVARIVMPEIAFEYTTPVITKALYQPNTQTIELEWSPLKGEVEYTVEIKECISDGETEDVKLDFGSNTSAITLPEGWVTESTGSKSNLYSSKDYIGESAPSFRFYTDGDLLTSPVYDDAISSVSFWVRGATASGSSALYVYGRKSDTDEWTQVYKVSPLSDYNSKGEILTFTPDIEMNQIKFQYAKSGGNCAFDDLLLTFPTISFIDHSRHEGLTTTTLSVPVDAREAQLHATVFATHKETGANSKVSDTAIVYTSATGISSILYEGTTVWYNLQGVPVAEPSVPGIYICRKGNTVRKVMVR